MERGLVAPGREGRLMDASLERLAKLYGIEPGYHDIWGQWRPTSDAAR